MTTFIYYRNPTPGTLVCVGDELPDPSFWPEGNGNASDGICLLPSSENI
ncbi:hypothetical protein T4A_5253 [Trichinella pseudospiralis]|uniref:Uncharacterized protein n=1 Tax=Trichinella pseudospiralis TaxID=6337 RepID=A0A0V1C6D7_TRIPS|nr:hypothetical protein T4A_5253 [Trichinella pseudospiralis]